MGSPMVWTTQSGFLTNNKLSKDFQRAAQPLLKFRQFVSIKEAFGKHAGESVNWLRVANIDDYGGDLVETNTMHETKQGLTWGTLSVNEMGNSIPFTFKIEALSEFDVQEIVKGGLLDDSVKCLDGKIERQFNASPLRYVGSSTTTYAFTTNSVATATNTSILNSYHIRKMVLELKKRNVSGYSKLGGDYGCVASLEAIENLQGAMETINSYTESGYKKILSGEVGRIHGVRFVEDAFASRFTYDSTAKTATAKSWTGANSLDAYFFGSPTVMEAIVVPEEIRMKVVTDYGRSKGIAWYWMGGFKIVREIAADATIIKWDSA